MAIHYHDLKQGTQEWFALHKGRVTGSNAFEFLRTNKIPEFKSGGDNYWSERGKILEDQSINIYEQIKQCKVEHCGFVTNDKYKHAGYSPDGFNSKLIESKSFKDEKHLALTDEYSLPPEVRAQVQLGMLVMELPETDVLLYNPDVDIKNAFKIINIKANKSIQDNLIKKMEGIV